MKKNKYTGQVLKLALPIVLQNLLSSAVSSCDVLMLNPIGQSAIAAVSLAAQYTTIITMVTIYGLGTGVSILAAQYYGKGDYKALKAIEGIALRFAVGCGIVIALCTFLFPRQMMLVFTSDEELIAIGASYLRVMGIGYFCWSVAEGYLAMLRSTRQVVVSTAINTMTFILNIILNAVFIFGLFGAPKLGATGVAVATSISRAVELLACVAVSTRNKIIRMNPLYMFMKSRALMKDFVKLSLPALLNDLTWGLAFSMYSVIMGHLGSDVVAANSFVSVSRSFCTTMCFAVGAVSGIIVGNYLGANEIEDARASAKELMRLTIIAGAIGGGLILVILPFALRFASISETAKHYLFYMMLINVYYVEGQAINTTLITGIFRAGGNTRFGLWCDLIDMWVYSVPLGFLAAFVFKLPVLWVYFLLCTDEFVKWPWVFSFYKKEKWIRNITRDEIA